MGVKAGGLSQNGNSRPPPARTAVANMKTTANCSKGLVLILVLVLEVVLVRVRRLVRVLVLILVLVELYES